MNWIFFLCDSAGLRIAANSKIQKSISLQFRSVIKTYISFALAFTFHQVYCFPNLPNYKNYLVTGYKLQNTGPNKGHFDVRGVADRVLAPPKTPVSWVVTLLCKPLCLSITNKTQQIWRTINTMMMLHEIITSVLLANSLNSLLCWHWWNKLPDGEDHMARNWGLALIKSQ